MDCKYAISFTSVLIDDLKISNCNVVNNSIRNNIDQSGIVPALVHVRLKSIIIQYFYFANNKFLSNNLGSFASRGNSNDDKSVIITLENCYSDDNDSSRVNSEYIITNLCDFNNNEIKTAHISQLFLGECFGEKKPDPFILSSVFTPSNVFTLSTVFSKSDAFTCSEKFSNSGFFSPSSNLIVNDKDASVDDKKGLGTGPMVGIIVAAVAAVAAIVGLVAFFIWKKKHIIQFSSDPNLIDTGENSVTVDNNLRSMMDKDDPFVDEFH